MKMMYCAAAVLLVSSTSAFAQGAALPSGPRAEATVGWDHVVIRGGGDSIKKSGVEYGGELGYDVAVGVGTLIGGYAGIDGASTEACDSTGTTRLCLKEGRNFQVGGRIGALIGNGSIAYLKGGYSNGRLRATLTDSAAPANNAAASKNLNGFHIGAGAEVALRKGFYVKGEYTYTRYSNNDLNNADIHLNRHRVLGGVGYRF